MHASSGPDMTFFKRCRENGQKSYITGSNEVPDDVCSTIVGFLLRNNSEMVTTDC